MIDHVLDERNIRLHAANAELAQRPVGALAGALERRIPGGHLDQQGIVVGLQLRTRVGGGAVKPDAQAGGRAIGRDAPVVRREIVFRVFGRDAALDREAVDAHVFLLRQIERRLVELGPLRDQDLRAHDVDARHHLGHRVLDLNARVDLDEVPLLRVRIHQELDRPGVHVVRLAGDRHRRIAQSAARLVGKIRRRGELHDFLMPALHRAVALVQVHHAAVRVGDHLHLDVPRPRHETLDEHSAVAERQRRLLLRLFDLRGQVRLDLHDAHAATAAAEGRLDDDREADRLGDLDRLPRIGDRVVRAGDDRHARPPRKLARGQLVAQHLEQLRRRPDKDDPRLVARPREIGIFRQEPVPRVNRVHPVLFRRGDDSRDVEIGRDRPLAGADHIGFVRFEAVQTQLVFLRKNSGCAQTELGGGAHDANRDFAAIGG